MNKLLTKKITLCIAIVFASLITLSLAYLGANSVHADVTVSAKASVIVSSACSFSSTVNSAHSATIPAGTYQSEIGTTTFNVLCNDGAGFSIYAIGYSDYEIGNTKLLANVNGSLAPTYDITTGTATSGSTSKWAMKLNAVSGTYAPTIQSDANGSFASYHAVPSVYTKVATFASSTDATTGSSLRSTYAAYIAGAQPAGTYNGKVRYTLVHPSSDAPNQPRDCTSNKICYWPNGGSMSSGGPGVVDTMGDQTASANASVMLWASNFKRDGYGFAGWNTAYDYSGTTYGPNETITTPSDMSNGLSLYAVWVKSTGVMQNFTETQCSSMYSGEVIALTDSRDKNTYAVAKLADGLCWMIENLRLSNVDSNSNTVILNTSNTNNPVLPLVNSRNQSTGDIISSSNSLSASSSAWCSSDYMECTDQSLLNTANTASAVASMTNGNQNVYSYGNYYNWYSATAGRGDYYAPLGDVSGDVCPSGWVLPTGGHNGDFDGLDAAIGNSDEWQNYPNNFIGSGIKEGNSINDRGNGFGVYWSRTIELVPAEEITPDTTINHDSALQDTVLVRILILEGVPVPTGSSDAYIGASVRCRRAVSTIIH